MSHVCKGDNVDLKCHYVNFRIQLRCTVHNIWLSDFFSQIFFHVLYLEITWCQFTSHYIFTPYQLKTWWNKVAFWGNMQWYPSKPNLLIDVFSEVSQIFRNFIFMSKNFLIFQKSMVFQNFFQKFISWIWSGIQTGALIPNLYLWSKFFWLFDFFQKFKNVQKKVKKFFWESSLRSLVG